MSLFNKFVFILVFGMSIVLMGNYLISKNFDSKKDHTVIDDSFLLPDISVTTEPVVSEPDSTSEPLVKKHNLKLQALKGCLETQSCHYPNEDPKSYQYAVFKDMKAQLKKLYLQTRAEKVESQKIKEIALEFLAEDHDEVKLEALKLLSTQKNKDESIELIFEEVFESPNPKSSAFAMQIFASFTETESQQKVNEGLFKVLTRGSVYSALSVAQNINLVVDTSNRQYFIDAASEIQSQGVSQQVFEELRSQLNF